MAKPFCYESVDLVKARQIFKFGAKFYQRNKKYHKKIIACACELDLSLAATRQTTDLYQPFDHNESRSIQDTTRRIV
jgi:hypothetical protein